VVLKKVKGYSTGPPHPYREVCIILGSYCEINSIAVQSSLALNEKGEVMSSTSDERTLASSVADLTNQVDLSWTPQLDGPLAD
jgi:hypothetical protein